MLSVLCLGLFCQLSELHDCEPGCCGFSYVGLRYCMYDRHGFRVLDPICICPFYVRDCPFDCGYIGYNFYSAVSPICVQDCALECDCIEYG